MKPVIVLLAFGNNEGIFAESLLCIASWLRFEKDFEFDICIFTDRPTYYSTSYLSKKLLIVPITTEKIEEWKKPYGFIFRAKIKCLQEASLLFKEPLLYLDTDTVLLKPPTELWNHLASGGLIMHADEGLIRLESNPIMRKMHRFLLREKPRYQGLNQKPELLSMWNAGVLGFSTQQSEWLNLILEVSDDLYHRYPKHMMEQFAFSWVFQERGKLKAAYEYIWHYWFYKSFREQLLPHVNGMLSAKNQLELWEIAEPFYDQLLQKVGPEPKAPFIDRLLKRIKILF